MHAIYIRQEYYYYSLGILFVYPLEIFTKETMRCVPCNFSGMGDCEPVNSSKKLGGYLWNKGEKS